MVFKKHGPIRNFRKTGTFSSSLFYFAKKTKKQKNKKKTGTERSFENKRKNRIEEQIRGELNELTFIQREAKLAPFDFQMIDFTSEI